MTSRQEFTVNVGKEVMRILALMILGLMVVGCGEKPAKELTLEEKVVGTYERKEKDYATYKFIFLENGLLEYYSQHQGLDKPIVLKGEWEIVDGGFIQWVSRARTTLFKINQDKSITQIAHIDKGQKRIDYPKETQDKYTFKKIK